MSVSFHRMAYSVSRQSEQVYSVLSLCNDYHLALHLDLCLDGRTPLNLDKQLQLMCLSIYANS